MATLSQWTCSVRPYDLRGSALINRQTSEYPWRVKARILGPVGPSLPRFWLVQNGANKPLTIHETQILKRWV